MKSFLGSMAALAIGAMLVGCHNDAPSSPPPPATQPVAVTPTSGNQATAQPPVVVKPAMPDKDMTHTLSADAPYYKSMPAKDAKPDGTWKSGTKVLVMIPGAPMSKVEAQTGDVGYVPTDDLQPISNK